MFRLSSFRLVGVAAFLFAATMPPVAPTFAQSATEADTLNAEAMRLFQSGRYADAVPIAQRVLALREAALGPDHPSVVEALNGLADLYRAQGRYVDAEPLYRRALSSTEKDLGADHLSVATSLNGLAELYRLQGRMTEAEPLYKRSLAIREGALGGGHADVSQSLNGLALLYQAQGRLLDAEPLFKRSLAIREATVGPNHLTFATALNSLAELYRLQARFAEAEPLYARSLAIRETVVGAHHPSVATALNNIALLFVTQGRTADAEPLYARALAIREAALGPDHPLLGLSLNNLADLYRVQGRYREAEPLYRRALSIRERTLGPDHPDVGRSLNNLAGLNFMRGLYGEAEPLYKRSLANFEKALGPGHPEVSTSLNNLAYLYQTQGRSAEAEALYRRALAIREQAVGRDHPDVGTALNNLAELYRADGRFAEAEPLYERSHVIREKTLGEGHPDVAQSLNNLGLLYAAQGRHDEAERLYKRALEMTEKNLGADHNFLGYSLHNLAQLYADDGRAREARLLFERSLTIRERALGADHPDVAQSLNGLAWLGLGQNDFVEATDRWRRATAVLQRRAKRGLNNNERGSMGEAQRSRRYFEGLIKTTWVLSQEGRDGNSAAEMFEAAQWVQASEAARSLAQMAARSAAEMPALSSLVRERQDLIDEWQAKDKQLIALKSEAPSRRPAGAEGTLAERLAAIDIRRAAIDGRLAIEFPDYAALANPGAVSVSEVQASLRSDEALILFLDTVAFKALSEETFVWVVTKNEVRWQRSSYGAVMLRREVAALRCGLDASAWYGEGALACATALGLSLANAPVEGQPLPFDIARASRLYDALFRDVEDLIDGKHLLIVPAGPLTKLPLHVLLKRPPPVAVGSDGNSLVSNAATLRPLRWLLRDHALTVLPSVSSLKSLRRVAKSTRADLPYLGFGNPLLEGWTPGHARLARLARERETCREAILQRHRTGVDRRGGIEALATREGVADVVDVRAQLPLPETADELCAVAHDLGAGLHHVRLGPHATETALKNLGTSGDLARYRIIHFATHGTMAGDLSGTTEPGLILTPPLRATPEDDGYLSSTEIASLKLDADWVILSACNTAGSDEARNAEALSGLARAFFYAGARALLVSHWEVFSDATVKLVTSGIRTMVADDRVGRAEAMRKAMLAMIESGAPHQAHPSYWAPFVVVGEGSVSNRP
jgi:tetratricopeptide (TPR) repeat protein/CHAT domain-containing protein